MKESCLNIISIVWHFADTEVLNLDVVDIFDERSGLCGERWVEGKERGRQDRLFLHSFVAIS